jgi:hypothetical protein
MTSWRVNWYWYRRRDLALSRGTLWLRLEITSNPPWLIAPSSLGGCRHSAGARTSRLSGPTVVGSRVRYVRHAAGFR